MDIRLIPVEPGGGFYTDFSYDAGLAEEVSSQYAAYYARTGYQKPWIGYMAACAGEIVGTCSFKGPPLKGKVEIAYFVFPAYESKGYATHMVRLLTAMALDADPSLLVIAKTLPRKDASPRVLEKAGFVLSGKVRDAEDGEVWEWQYKNPRARSSP